MGHKMASSRPEGPVPRRLAIVMAVVFLSAGAALSEPRPPRRTLAVRDLGSFDGADTLGVALNETGQIVGIAVTGSATSSFLWESGSMSDIGPGTPVDINNRGQILLQTPVGNPDDPSPCYVLDGTTLTELEVPTGWQCHPADLNDAGQVTGSLSSSGGLSTTRGFLWSAGTFADLGTLGGDIVLPLAMNERGQVVGAAMTPSGYEHAFLWDAGVMTDLGVPAGLSSRATAINDRGQVLVQSGPRVYLFEAGAMTDLGTMGAQGPDQFPLPIDLNDRGQILIAVADAQVHTYRYSLWTAGRPAPLPTLGGGEPGAVRLNDLGQVTGTDRAGEDSTWHLALWSTVVTRGRRPR